jgi:hypothetical protein
MHGHWRVNLDKENTGEVESTEDMSEQDCLLPEPGPQASSNGDATLPTAYIFQEGDGLCSGAPELATGVRVSFDIEPHWLDVDGWNKSEGSEAKDGFCLEYHKEYVSFLC